MTDEEITALAKQERQIYCDTFNEGINLPTYHCEAGCPLYRSMNHCGSAEFYIGFIDGFKAALNEICKDVDKHVCKITFQDTGKDD